MERTLNDLIVRLRTKGFLPVEIPDFVNDTLNLVGSDNCSSINDVNHELEDFGWGIDIMDHGTYGLITALCEKNVALILSGMFKEANKLNQHREI